MNRGSSSERFFHFAGIGAGPANLSLAALSESIPHINGRFFERAPELAWHPGLLFPESLLQTSFLKDLVTPVDPTNGYSFLSYLVAHKQLYSFITANFPQISRAEFGQYLAWVSRSLRDLELGCSVESVDLSDSGWRLQTSNGRVRARDIVLGTGRQPWVPEHIKPALSDRVFHSAHYNYCRPELKGKRVAVIGGGQSGAEIFYHAILESAGLPERLVWVSRRANFLPLDDSPFANEWFTPEYSHSFYNMSREHKSAAVAEQTLASDGVSMGLLEDIYRRMYQLRFVERRDPRMISLLPGHDCVDIEDRAGQAASSGEGAIAVALRNGQGQTRLETFDYVICATGYRWTLPPMMEHLRGRLKFIGDEPATRADFSLVWDGAAEFRIFAQNAARLQRGVADPNLSLLAWRSAVIANRLAERKIYDVAPAQAIIDWASQTGESRYEETHITTH